MQAKLLDVIAKSWTDADYKQRLMANPAQVLAEDGIAVPAGANVRVIEHGANDVYLFLPPRPQGEVSVANVASSAASSAGLTDAGQPASAMLTVQQHGLRLTDVCVPATAELTRGAAQLTRGTARLTEQLTDPATAPLTDRLTDLLTDQLTDQLTRPQSARLTVAHLTVAATPYLTVATVPLTIHAAAHLTVASQAHLTVASARLTEPAGSARLTEPAGSARLTEPAGNARLTEPAAGSALLTVAPKGPEGSK